VDVSGGDWRGSGEPVRNGGRWVRSCKPVRMLIIRVSLISFRFASPSLFDQRLVVAAFDLVLVFGNDVTRGWCRVEFKPGRVTEPVLQAVPHFL
jgi:hypothetical protein